MAVGMWQGIAQAVSEESERRFLQSEKEKDRAYEREMWLEKVAEERKNSLIDLYVQSAAARSEAVNKYAGPAAAFLSRFDGDEQKDERVQFFRENPAAAAQVEEELRARELAAAKEGKPMPVTRGLSVLDYVDIYTTEEGDTQVEVPDIDTILSGDFSDYDSYAQTAAALKAGGAGGAYISVSPELGYAPDPKRLEDATQVWDNQSIMIASRKLEELDPTAVGYTELRNIIDGADKGDPVSLGALRTKYGPQALTELETANNPAVSYLRDNPTVMQYTAPPPVTASTTSAVDFNRFSREQLDQIGQELVAALNDPNSSEQEKVEAEQYLRELQTFLEGSR